MNKCSVCGAEIPIRCDKCRECNKKAIQELFRKSPELKQAFQETIEEMRKPENVKKMVDQIVPVVQKVAELQAVGT